MTPIEKRGLLKEGVRVKVVLPDDMRSGYERLYDEIRRYNGRELTIINVTKTSKGFYYELDMAKSAFGIYYGFVGEWLIPITDID